MQEKNVASTPDSKLSPFATRGPALVRYTSTPVYATANTNRASPDGVLISEWRLQGGGGAIQSDWVAAYGLNGLVRRARTLKRILAAQQKRLPS
jgi:hypothetical protein